MRRLLNPFPLRGKPSLQFELQIREHFHALGGSISGTMLFVNGADNLSCLTKTLIVYILNIYFVQFHRFVFYPFFEQNWPNRHYHVE